MANNPVGEKSVNFLLFQQILVRVRVKKLV